jgi:hypothetical protein
MTEGKFNPDKPACRLGIVARDLVNGMVYIRHPGFSSRIINRESWSFLQLCDGRDLEQLSQAVARLLGFALTHEQLSSSIREFADRGVFEGANDNSRSYRICDATPIISKLSPLVRWVGSSWFAGLTLLALLACLALLASDWGRFITSVTGAARERPVETLLLYYLTFIPIALLHELGHAAVANSYGGEVPEIVINSKGHFAVVTNMTVLKDRRALAWYLGMGTVVDVFVWLALLTAFHYCNHYLLLMFLLPQTIYFMIFSYSIFKNSDYLKFVCALLDKAVPTDPWKFLRDCWSSPRQESAKRKLLLVMTASLAIKVLVTAFLIWTFLKTEPRVLVLYLIYRILVYIVGHWTIWWRRWTNHATPVPSLQPR